MLKCKVSLEKLQQKDMSNVCKNGYFTYLYHIVLSPYHIVIATVKSQSVFQFYMDGVHLVSVKQITFK